MLPSASHPRRLRRTWWAAWVLVALALLVGAVAMRNGGRPAAPSPSPAPTLVEPMPPPAGPAVPFPIKVQLSGGFDQTSAGAINAAVAYVTAGPALLDMDTDGAVETVRAMAAAATADAQAEDLRLRLADLRRALGGGNGPLRYYRSAIATRVEAFTPASARVAVWHLGVVSKAGIAPPQAGWAISVVDLVWEAGDWKLVRESVSPGPAPILDSSAPPATAEELDAALVGFAVRDAR